jgi:hypothetical protein
MKSSLTICHTLKWYKRMNLLLRILLKTGIAFRCYLVNIRMKINLMGILLEFHWNSPYD